MTKRSTKPTVEMWSAQVNASPGGSVTITTLRQLAEALWADLGWTDVSEVHFRTCIAAWRRHVVAANGIRTDMRFGTISFLTQIESMGAGARDMYGNARITERRGALYRRTIDPRKMENEEDKKRAALIGRALEAQEVAANKAVKDLRDSLEPADVSASPRVRLVK